MFLRFMAPAALLLAASAVAAPSESGSPAPAACCANSATDVICNKIHNYKNLGGQTQVQAETAGARSEGDAHSRCCRAGRSHGLRAAGRSPRTRPVRVRRRRLESWRVGHGADRREPRLLGRRIQHAGISQGAGKRRRRMQRRVRVCSSIGDKVTNGMQVPPTLKPVLIGYSSGATIAYAALAQAGDTRFSGAMTLGFCPDLIIHKPFCAAPVSPPTNRRNRRMASCSTPCPKSRRRGSFCRAKSTRSAIRLRRLPLWKK